MKRYLVYRGNGVHEGYRASCGILSLVDHAFSALSSDWRAVGNAEFLAMLLNEGTRTRSGVELSMAMVMAVAAERNNILVLIHDNEVVPQLIETFPVRVALNELWKASGGDDCKFGHAISDACRKAAARAERR